MVSIDKITIRQLRLSDYEALKTSMSDAYGHHLPDLHWTQEQIQTLIDCFPEGQFVVLVDGKVAGCALAIIVDYDLYGDEHTFLQVTGEERFDTHDPTGDTLYGIEVFITPEFRGLRLGRRLYDTRKELCEHLNLRGIVFGGRIPNYHKYSDLMRPREYIEQVRMKDIHDPVLNFQLSNDFHVKKVLKGYMPGDTDSMEYAVLLQWSNIYFTADTRKGRYNQGVVRLGLVQWQMRPYRSLDEVFQQMEYFVDAVSDYQCDFALIPEYFNAPLMAVFNELSEARAIRQLAEYTSEVRDRFHELAINYNINIITGSMPELRDDGLYNVGFLCRRDGSVEQYEKIHVTPDEVSAWGLRGGNRLRVFDTDAGRVGILICYDVEFPELSRLLADQGMQILFVPFLTDTQNGYSRVRHCAQARAIENECYVAIAGSVGNLPKVHNMDIQYAQSVVFTPCDFAFPTNGVKTEATPNTEMILIADVNLDLLRELHSYGSVQNLKNRRLDLYGIQMNASPSASFQTRKSKQ